MPQAYIFLYLLHFSPDHLIGIFSLIASIGIQGINNDNQTRDKVIHAIATFSCWTINTILSELSFLLIEHILCMIFPPSAPIILLISNPFIRRAIILSGGLLIGKLLKITNTHIPEKYAYFYAETMNSLKEKILYLVISSAGKLFLSKEKKEEFKSTLESIDKFMDRSMHISYKIKPQDVASGTVTIKKSQDDDEKKNRSS